MERDANGVKKKGVTGLTTEEINLALEYYSQKSQVENFDRYFATKSAPKQKQDKKPQSGEKKQPEKKNGDRKPAERRNGGAPQAERSLLHRQHSRRRSRQRKRSPQHGSRSSRIRHPRHRTVASVCTWKWRWHPQTA